MSDAGGRSRSSSERARSLGASGTRSADEYREEAIRQQADCDRSVESRTHPSGWEESRVRIAALRNQMRSSLVKRESAVDAVLASIISRTGCVLLGPPGTAKSLLVRRVAEACDLRVGAEDSNYFEYLLTAHTMPEEVFGPTDIGLLLQKPPLVQRRTEARLPHAELAFLDEVFRGGSHILNTLLTILNERKFHNGRQIEEVPLVGFIGAANQEPQSDELNAFFDRFPVRVWVDSVLAGNPTSLVSNARKLLEADSNRSTPNVGRGTGPSMHDFRKLWAVLRIKMAPEQTSSRQSTPIDQRLREFTEFFTTIRRDFDLSDRSFVQLWYFGGALDMIEERDPHLPYPLGGRGHLLCFNYVSPKQKLLRRLEDQVRSIDRRLETSGA